MVLSATLGHAQSGEELEWPNVRVLREVQRGDAPLSAFTL